MVLCGNVSRYENIMAHWQVTLARADLIFLINGKAFKGSDKDKRSLICSFGQKALNYCFLFDVFESTKYCINLR